MADRRKAGKQALTVRIDPAVIARLKAVARDAAGKPLFCSVSGIVEAGVISECDRIEAVLNAVIIDPKSAPPHHESATRRHLPLNNDHCTALRR
jgi:hypothetical protein